jgi:DNA processing protein
LGKRGKLWYQLYRTRGIGVKTLHNINEAVMHSEIKLEALFDMTFDELRSRLELNKNICVEINKTGEGGNFKEEFKELQHNNIKVIHLQHKDYPRKVYERLGNDSPPIFFCMGCTNLLNKPSIAVSGARDASDFGIDTARMIGEHVAKNGKCLVSGYARGIDTAAHLGALKAGGNTAIIFSQGIYHFSLKVDFRVMDEKENYVVLSQFHPHEVWRGRNAMLRNKITVALSDALIIIECGSEIDEFGHQSGTFNTGITALELGVPLYVVRPDLDIFDFKGNTKLIEMGGIEVRLEDVLENVLLKK